MTLIVLLVCLALLMLRLGTTVVPLTDVWDNEQVNQEKNGLAVLKEILSTLQSMDESTASEAGKLKLSEEQSQEVVSHEKVSEHELASVQATNQEVRHRAFLQHAL